MKLGDRVGAQARQGKRGFAGKVTRIEKPSTLYSVDSEGGRWLFYEVKGQWYAALSYGTIEEPQVREVAE